MQLSDNEKRDIQKYLDENKPLPDKYRFLLFEDKREVELVWNGKTNEVTNVVLPFQVIEQVDEPREEKDSSMQMGLFDLDSRGRQLKGWTNKLIWGDNKLVLSSLKNGALREEIEKQGGIKLIYIDPPFDVGADFSMNIEVGDEEFTKKPNILEELAYRDTWGKGADSFIAMIYERLSLMRDLLAEDGSIYVHCDWRVSSYMRLILDEIFGKDNFQSEIVWRRSSSKLKALSNKLLIVNDYILHYTKDNSKKIYNTIYWPYSEEYKKRFTLKDERGYYYWAPLGTYSKERYERLKSEGMIKDIPGKMPRMKNYLGEGKGVPPDNVWVDIDAVNSQALEDTGYDTQKPERLIKRILETSSNKGDLVADFFCGSGTTLATAEKLGRKWIGSDLGKFGIHTTRKRMIEVQRELRKEGKDYRAFEILNLGKYERQHYIGINQDLRSEEKQKQIAEREEDFTNLILQAYKAESVEGFKTFYGKKNARMVAIGAINLPVSRLFVEEVIDECSEKKITKVDILGFEFEMGLFPKIQEEAKEKGIDLALKYIPRDVFDKRAIEKNQVVFYDVSFIEVKPHTKGSSISIELTDFSVFYNQDSIAQVEESLKNGSNKIVVENGQIIKVSKDKNGITNREVLTKKWTDWIDYWSVDFDFESKKELIRVPKKEGNKKQKLDGTMDLQQAKLPEYEEVWSGDYIFENEWQSFRTKKDRKLELQTPFIEVPKGRRKIAIKVVDIFGNDTMKVIEVKI